MGNFVRYKSFGKLFAHNIEINGLRAIIYPFNLTASRYVEYSAAINFAGNLKPNGLVLEVGCGHSILPTLWQKLGAKVIAVDINRKALKRQLEKSKIISVKYRDEPIEPVVASIKNLPFKSVFSLISCISAIEHVPHEGDIMAIKELGMILETNGLIITSFPLSPFKNSYTQSNPSVGIPFLFGALFKPILFTIYSMFRVDRTASYFERNYSIDDVQHRIITPSNCKLEEFFAFRNPRIMKLIHGRIIPIGISSAIEYLLSRTFTIKCKSMLNMDAVVIKLRKIAIIKSTKKTIGAEE
jgi:SAM-dependent methyltransferase